MKLKLVYAGGLYDRTVALQNGSVSAEGIDLNFVMMHAGEFQRRQARNAEFDASELSLSTYTILLFRRRAFVTPIFTSIPSQESKSRKICSASESARWNTSRPPVFGSAAFWRMSTASALSRSSGI